MDTKRPPIEHRLDSLLDLQEFILRGCLWFNLKGTQMVPGARVELAGSYIPSPY